ncbi:MAG: filamentous hemagglutinin N-terminal domain-containing protein [Variovorax sp.]|nr:MAG: filamentous hemagglutinin N-terminal domain-containing protein [Variovorax sp.]
MTTSFSAIHASRPGRWRLRPLALSLVCMGAGSALAQFPTVGNVVRGSASIGAASGNTMGINQTSARAIINWNSFSVGQGNQLNITQEAGPRSVLLNRVVNNGPRSEILGSITAPGHVFIVNPAGVVFGSQSQVNVGGLVASTLDIDNDAFAAGDRVNVLLGKGDKFNFTRGETTLASIQVDKGAQITTTAPGGTVALMGANVSNAGNINVAQGSIGLLSGRSATIDFEGDGLTTFKVSTEAADIATKAVVANTGTITANGGRVHLAAVSSEAKALVVNQEGIIRARSMAERGGQILLQGDGSGTAEIRIAGELDASGTEAGVQGGTITALGRFTRLDGAQIDVSGATGGKAQLVGINAFNMSPEASVRADATGANGQGGTVAVGSIGATHISGSLSARGAGTGAGGKVGTAGLVLEVAQGASIDASGGAQGANGTWTASSTGDLTVAATVPAYDSKGYAQFYNAVGTRVGAEAIGRSLSNGTDVVLESAAAKFAGRSEGAGIGLEAGASILMTGPRAATLTVNSDKSIFMTGASIRSSGGALNVNFNADAGGAALGEVQQIQNSGDEDLRTGIIALGGATIETAGGNVRFYGQGDAENGRAVGAFNVEGVIIEGSRISTCAAGAGVCEGTGGSIRIRGEGATTRFSDNVAFSGSGVRIQAGDLQTGSGRIDIDGRGGIGSAGVVLAPLAIAGKNIPTSVRSSSGDVAITGSSRSLLGADTRLIAVGNPTGTAEGYGAGTGVSLLGVNVATGGNVAITGKGGDMSLFLDDPFNVEQLAKLNVNFAAGNGLVTSASSISAGRGKTLDLTGTAGSRSTAFSIDAEGNPVITPGALDAFAVGVVGVTGKGLVAESGTVNIRGGTGDVVLVQATTEDVGGPDGQTRMISTASQTGAGGSINVSGRNVLIGGDGATTRLDSSGVGQGGTVSVRTTAVDGEGGVIAMGKSALLEANAVGSGNGGRIEVIGDTGLRAYGRLSARGGASGGNGGFVETSAANFEMAGIRVDASAPVGIAGTWLIDPFNVSIVSGTAAGTLPTNPFDAPATSTVTDGDINAALNGGTSVKITTGTGGTDPGDIIMTPTAKISYTADKGPLTFELGAFRNIDLQEGSVIQSSGTAGPLNVVLNAGVNPDGSPTAAGGQVVSDGNIYTNGGNVTMNGRTTAVTNSGVFVRGVIDTRGGNALDGGGASTGGSNAIAGGNVQLNGSNTTVGSLASRGVWITGSQILTSTGSVTVRGESGSGSGVDITDSNIGTTSGLVTVTGSGRRYTSGLIFPTAGVLISRSTVSSVAGGITLRGLYADDPAYTDLTPGVRITDASVVTTTGGGAIEVSGQAVNSNQGVLLEAGPSGLPSRIQGSGQVVLRASNDGSTDAIAINGQVSAGTVLNLRPGGVDAAGNGFDSVANPITLGGTAATGFALSEAELALLGGPAVVVGSNAHAADINVVGPLAMAPALTLQNQGGGNINLGASVTAPQLALLAGGNVTQAAGANITAGSLLARAQTGSVLLSNAGNNVGVATGSAAGRFEYVDANALTIGPVSAATFDAAGNTPQIDAATSMAATNVFVRTLLDDLSLGTAVSSTAGADLVAAARFQNVGGASLGGAPWRVWANTWIGETRGGLAGSGRLPNLYNCAYTGLCTVTVSPGDNHFIYAQQPTATVLIGNVTRPIGVPNPPFRYTLAGLILGDIGAGFSGTLSSTANQFSLPGSYPITGSFASEEGYAIRVVPGQLRVSSVLQTPAVDVLRELPTTYLYDRNIGNAPICLATGPLQGDRADQGGDVLAREWSRVRSRPNLVNCVDTEKRNGCADF